MADAEIKKSAREFAEKWTGRGREDEDGRSFWIEFLGNVLGMENPTEFMNFEKKVKIQGGFTTGFVSTNSITQGEQVAGVWKPLYERFGVHIDFAYRTFKWDNRVENKKGKKEKNDEYMVQIHVVIVGFSIAENNAVKRIYEGDKVFVANIINPYLVNADVLFVEERKKPICDVFGMIRGSQPTDDGNLILTEEEKDELLKSEPQAEIFIRPYMMGRDFIHRKPRYCLWLVDANPTILNSCRKVMERIENVRQYRLSSSKKATQKKAETPALFDEIKACKTKFVALPKLSSGNRKYIPMDYLDAEIIAGDKLFMIPNCEIYHFGVLTSNVHMAWMRAVCGRYKSDYSYSNTVVYNNFPWCNPTPEQKAKIEKTAQAILDARANYPNASFDALYKNNIMPPALRTAHRDNDKAVMQAYGFKPTMTEQEIVAELMKMYQEMT